MIGVPRIPEGAKVEITPFGPRVMWPRDGVVWVYTDILPTWMPEEIREAFEQAKKRFDVKQVLGEADAAG